MSRTVLLALALSACERASDVDTDEPLEIDPARIYADVAWLADDARAGRQPAEVGNEDAMAYVIDELEDLGLDPGGTDGWEQAFPIPLWSVSGTPALSLGGSSLVLGDDFRPFELSGSADVDAELVFVGYGITVPPFDAADYPGCPLDPSGWDDYADVDVTDKVVLVLRHGPEDDEAIHEACPANEAATEEFGVWGFGYKASNAELHGAAAMLMVNHYGTGPGLLSATLDADAWMPDFASVWVDRRDAEAAVPDLPTWAIAADLAPAPAATDVQVELAMSTSIQELDTANLIAVLPGEDPALADEVVVLGAHIDHLGADPFGGAIYNGADDNASGSAVLLELARMAVHGGRAPARTVVFAWYNAEEMGLIGSCEQVMDPVFPLDDTVAMFSIDMVGAGDGTGLAVFGATVDPQQWVGELLDESSNSLGWAVYSLPPLMASDHACYALRGVPAVLISTLGAHSTYHTPDDTIDGILEQDLQAATETLWSGLEHLMAGTEGEVVEDARARRRGPLPPTGVDVGPTTERHRDR